MSLTKNQWAKLESLIAKAKEAHAGKADFDDQEERVQQGLIAGYMVLHKHADLTDIELRAAVERFAAVRTSYEDVVNSAKRRKVALAAQNAEYAATNYVEVIIGDTEEEYEREQREDDDARASSAELP